MKTETRPVCECHGEPMLKNGRGGWRCAVKHTAKHRAYRAANREKELARHRAYRETHYNQVREYEKTAKAMRRKIESDIQRGRDPERIMEGPRGQALREREEYEASGTSLSFMDWLNETHPLPKLIPIGRG